MGIQRDWGRRFQQWRTTEPQCEYINSNNSTKRREQRRHGDRKRDFFSRCTRLLQPKQLHADDSRCSISIHPDVSRTRAYQPDSHTKSNNYPKRHGYNKRLYPIALCLTQLAIAPATLAEGVGGVSATANPIANSSGSVTNQAIQVLQGPYVTNTYGGGVSCQGTTHKMTPYIQFADSRKDPWEDFYNEPQYNNTDVSGKMTPTYVNVKNYPWEEWYDDRTYTNDAGEEVRWFPDGSDITIIQDVDGANGVPDIIDTGGEMTPTWFKPVRTDMKANQSFNLGLSATLSIPLNRGMQRRCKDAAEAQTAAVQQSTANKRLDFEIARLKNCGELKKQGIFFHPASPYHSICADVVVTSPGGKILPHEHKMPQPLWKRPNSLSTSEQPSQPHSSHAAESDAPLTKEQAASALGLSLSPSQSPSLLEVSPPSEEGQQGALLGGPMSLPQRQSQP